MEQLLLNIVENFDYLLLVFVRVSALLMSSPIFGRRNIPNRAKIALCMVLTYLVFTAYPQTASLPQTGIYGYAILIILELLFGLVIGYITSMFFTITFTAGQVIDMQMGFGMVNIFDPNSNMQVPVTGNLLNIILLIIFFSVNGHLILIDILKKTFESIPVGGVKLSPMIWKAALDAFVMSFALAIHVAMPIIASGLLGEVALGIIVRTSPQTNVFVVGMPIKVALGFIVIYAFIPVYVNFSERIFNGMWESLENMFFYLGGG